MLISLELKKEDKSLGAGECKEAGFLFYAIPDGNRHALFLEMAQYQLHELRQGQAGVSSRRSACSRYRPG
jgi:hypothetical protein